MRMPTLVALAVLLAGCASGEPSRIPPQDPSPRNPHGARLYRGNCAGCHGESAHGNGPIAPLLRIEVPDLTLIAARRGGNFPELEIYRIIDGQADLGAHGPRHMPVWGYEFFGDDTDDELAHRAATEKVEQLVGYLRSIQRAE
jgi:mono/diheme cytochrome c family protein